jgi:hypothetical protein
LGLADGGDAPAGATLGIQAVGLEGDYGLTGRGGQLAAVVRPDNDVAVINGEVNQFHGRQRLPGVDDPAHRHRCHEVQAFIPGQSL